MTIILVSICLFFSILNFIFIVFLSNSIFRFLAYNASKELEPLPINKTTNNTTNNNNNRLESGLVDPKPTSTYDPRFRN